MPKALGLILSTTKGQDGRGKKSRRKKYLVTSLLEQKPQ
jgi:hypothetical protein